MKIAVVTPTIGTSHLQKCIKSVSDQTYKHITHYVFVDGKDFFAKVKGLKSKKPLKKVMLEENTGHGGWLGHRVYAACPFLVDADYICYLDEDNWIEPNHVASLVNQIEAGRDWAFSLRKIFTEHGDYLFEDNCESLGKWPVFNDEKNYHLDTSSYMVPISIASAAAISWYRKWNADRSFFATIREHFPNFGGTGLHTLCYRLGGNQNSVSRSFFEAGNKFNAAKFETFPWKF